MTTTAPAWPSRRTVWASTWTCHVDAAQWPNGTGCRETGHGGIPGFYRHLHDAHPDHVPTGPTPTGEPQ